MKTNDRPLTDLMKAVDSGAAQLPDFQRGWVWDNERIKALILSVIRSFPVGALDSDIDFCGTKNGNIDISMFLFYRNCKKCHFWQFNASFVSFFNMK